MKAAAIPQYAVASKAVAASQHFRGTVLLSHLTRLAPQLAAKAGSLDVDLTAEKDRAGAPWLKGSIKGILKLTCQRGEHPFDWSCDLQTALRLVTSDAEEKRLLAACEPYRVEDDRLPLRELVEDEVLLALPMLPKCENPDCIRKGSAPHFPADVV
jgi:uncharacterized protein